MSFVQNAEMVGTKEYLFVIFWKSKDTLLLGKAFVVL